MNRTLLAAVLGAALLGAAHPAHAGRKPSRKALRAMAEAAELERAAMSDMLTAQTSGDASFYDRALGSIDQAIALHPEPPYGYHQTRALILALQQKPEAAAAFEQTLESYLASPEPPDDEMAMTAYTAVGFTAVQAGDIDAALRLCALGRQVAAITDGTVSAVDFDIQEVKILIQQPDRQDEADQKLDALASAHPDNSAANLLKGVRLSEAKDWPASRTYLTRALDGGADPATTLFYLASAWVNESIEVRIQANELDDLDQSMPMHARADALLASAQPHFEALNKLQPDDLEAVRQFLSIAITVGDEEATRRWMAEKERIESGG